MSKFTPVHLASLFNGERPAASPVPSTPQTWRAEVAGVLATLPSGEQTFWGVPLELGPGGAGARSWVLLHAPQAPVSIPLDSTATYVLVAHFCNSSDTPGDTVLPPGYVTAPGQHLADYVLVYADGAEHRAPIRRRFEINSAAVVWGQRAFGALPHSEPVGLDLRGPYERNGWGRAQTGLGDKPGGEAGQLWIYALPNPRPEARLATLRLEPTGADVLAVAAVTLYHGAHHPLRRERLTTLRVTVPEGADPAMAEATVDMGTIARRYAVPAFEPEEWLAAVVQGWGEEGPGRPAPNEVLLDVTASPDATLYVAGSAVSMQPLFEDGRTESADGRLRVEVLTPHTAWVHVRVEDASTGAPTPVRVHFRAPDGRYLPPYGHRHEVNDNWFEDYGADLKLGSTQYAYVDGRFQIELPVGDVYVEAAKGFEYRPLRRRLTIAPGQRELTLALERPINLRREGWVTADTHVHFISPQTAWLEAQAEGLNLVNLLASQWGDLFTNVGDLTGDLSGVSRDDTLVWVGTENRQHLLGHMSLLGGRGEPVYPMCAGGPAESYLGDPLWTSLAEWSDRCRERDGVVIMPHFPNPYCEVVADIILGKVDGIELRDYRWLPTLDTFATREWYRFLNCGYRVAAVGGTDKMSAGMPVGGVRTYADLRGEELSYGAWAGAVRAGRTFTTTGPLLGLSVEGHGPGEEIRVPAGSSELQVHAWARSVQPFQTLEIVANGAVVASETARSNATSLDLKARVRLEKGQGWIAARCMGHDRVWHIWPVHMAAHTSPVYVTTGEPPDLPPGDAAYLLTLLDGGLTWIDTFSIPADAARQQQIRRIFKDAKAALHARQHVEGQGHHH